MSEQPAPRPLIVVPTKSVGIAILLTVFFGPLGMFYSTVIGAIVMFFINVLAIFFTAGLGLFVTWPIGIVWAAMAASSHNQRLLAGTRAF
ncbi:MAG TPA: hypothetical protein VGQ46_16645 [Thermoanaerobaculia bacterium]|jgi:uncharacterized membrane protein|nr:hypothetical protein [Thermoanaerobaculia bacterium]